MPKVCYLCRRKKGLLTKFHNTRGGLICPFCFKNEADKKAVEEWTDFLPKGKNLQFKPLKLNSTIDEWAKEYHGINLSRHSEFPKIIWMQTSQIKQIEAVKVLSDRLDEMGVKNVVDVPKITKLLGLIDTLKSKEPIKPLKPITLTICGKIALKFFNVESTVYSPSGCVFVDGKRIA